MNIIVATSTVEDGSMYNRRDMSDSAIITNRKNFLAANGIDISQTTRAKITYDRTDFCQYGSVDASQKGSGMTDNNAVILDALITTDSQHALFLPIADCVGAVLFDPIHHILALAHFGRHALEQDGGRKLVTYLTEHYASDPSQLNIWLTPAAGKDVYPIWALDNKGMKEVMFEQLFAAGVLYENIIDNPTETTSDLHYFSYSEHLKGHRTEDGDHAIVAMMTD